MELYNVHIDQEPALVMQEKSGICFSSVSVEPVVDPDVNHFTVDKSMQEATFF